jgi:tRNA pseudouridine32 synthase/23S rRNA pseudouridine746 synthase
MLCAMSEAHAGVSIVHEDAALLVADKPAGLLSVPGRGEAGRDNLSSRVQAIWPDALVVHRLDQATSGLLLFARGAAMQRALSIAFAERQVHKRYVAVVHGAPAQDQGEIALPLAADWPRRPRQQVDLAHGKPALTRWRCIARSNAQAVLDLEPVTGRSHQLRVHLQAIGHPIVGDTLYGPEPAATPRLLLHATTLAFQHPLHGQPVSFTSAAPFGLGYSEKPAAVTD